LLPLATLGCLKLPLQNRDASDASFVMAVTTLLARLFLLLLRS